MFDAQSFLQSNTVAATERKLIPIDTTNLYLGIVTSVDAKSGTSAKGNPWARLDIKVSIEDASVKEALYMPEVVRTFGVMLDLQEDGSYDSREGRNVNLGLTAKALGLDPKSFKPQDFIGRMAKWRIGYETFEGVTRDTITGALPQV